VGLESRLMKDIYDFAYPSRKVVMQVPRSRPVLNYANSHDTVRMMKGFEDQSMSRIGSIVSHLRRHINATTKAKNQKEK
jgi:hypothetical protein